MSFIVQRLTEGADLRQALSRLATERQLAASFIGSLVGSLHTASLRLSGQSQATSFAGPLEIVSATGTLSASGMHIHLSVSDSEGTTFGGHLLDGCIVKTTVEVVLSVVEDWVFDRELDPRTGYLELRPSKTAR